ncbi:MAG: hypothetical protein RL113_1144, partial [Pseudomonadota bacterium]
MEQKTKLNIAGKLANTFISHPLTLVLSIAILVVGLLSLQIMPREENPQIIVSGGAVIIPMPGAKADQVQKVIIEPLEKKIHEIKGVENIYSIARDSVGIVQAQFFIGEDKLTSDQKLYDQVMKNIDLLPKMAMQPIIKTMDIDTDIPIATIAFYSKYDSLSQVELYNIVDKLGHKLNKFKDVAQVNLKGARKEQINVLLNLDKLNDYGITLGQVAQALNNITFELPKAKADTLDGDYVSLSINNNIKSFKEIGHILVDSYNGQNIYLKDLGTIEQGENIQNKQIALLYTKLNDLESKEKQQVTLTISKLKGGNTVEINNQIFEYLSSIRKKLDNQGVGYVITRDDGYTANHAVNELVFHLIISVLIISVLLVFSLGFREALIVSLTVPMILSLTLFTGYLMGETINRITLFALLLSLGLLVDAAIIVIENIHRHLHSESTKEKSLKTIAVEATNEIGNPTNIATLAIIMTFIPMFFVGGMMGQFMHP